MGVGQDHAAKLDEFTAEVLHLQKIRFEKGPNHQVQFDRRYRSDNTGHSLPENAIT
jgi:hypothetical protein